MQFSNYSRASIKAVTANDSIFKSRIEACYKATIPSSIKQCRETGRIDAFKLDWKPGMDKQPHIFWDSDLVKVLEGIANILAIYPDAELEKEYDEIVSLIASAQQPDGYLNTYFTVVEPEKRWSNLFDCHELYCAGHMIEAGVAAYELLGKRELLDVVCKYADYIDSVFGEEEGKRRGVPGHEEIELALVRLYNATGNERYLKLSKYFIDERGREPNFYTEVEKTKQYKWQLERHQAHMPVREQSVATGHSVRAVYLYSGMADIATLTNDEKLFEACERLFKSITERRMYITGGIGSTFEGERFTTDYDLTNGSLMYAESCAAIGLVRFASRMLNATGNGHYAEIIERAIFNGVLCGISLKGDTFFYTNYLEVDDNTTTYNMGSKDRQPWFHCSCCPTNYCRFIPEMLEYVWSENDEEVLLNMPIANTFKSSFGELEVSGGYPYDGNISVVVKDSPKGKFSLGIRIPEWCEKYTITLNGQAITEKPVNGYIKLSVQEGDKLDCCFDMPIKIIYSNPKITNNAGRIALMRGPTVYACETIDNPNGTSNMIIDTQAGFELTTVEGLPEGTVAIKGKAIYETFPADGSLYFDKPMERTAGEFIAIPYALWNNRGSANMAVWIRQKQG